MNRVKFIVVQFPINSCHQRVVTLSHEEVDDSLTHVVFPINRCHQRVVTAAPERACAAGDPRTDCAPPTLAVAERGVKPVENSEIRCAAGSRADQRKHWGSG
jgi:hypothetical protein